MAGEWKNKLYFGDNLGILQNEIPDACVDLVYLDPPFNSKADYNVLYKNSSGEASAAQATAFKDTWEWDEAAAEAYHEIQTSARIPQNLKNLMSALKLFLTGDTGKKGNSMMAYLTMMALRLVELHRVLKRSGSLYLHCDPTASHYIKLVLDSLFGFGNYRSEVKWIRTFNTGSSKALSKKWPRLADTIFHYTKSDSFTFKLERGELSEGAIKRYDKVDANGRRFKWNPMKTYSEERLKDLVARGEAMITPTSKYPVMKVYFEESKGRAIGDVWDDLAVMGTFAQERLGYPTQKPEALLERIILASSNEGDLVLDPFCGCGTTIAVAEKLKRRWIGIDVTYLAVDLMERRLLDQFIPGQEVKRLADIPVQKRRHALKTYFDSGKDELEVGLQPGLSPFEVVGVPTDPDTAKFLFQNDPYQFEWWAVAMVGAQGKEYKKGGDRGIDGIITFQDKPGDYKTALVSVKGGKLGPTFVSQLKGDMQREGSVIGILITNEPATRGMILEAADAGRWASELHPDRSYPCIQILTAADLLEGKAPDIPRWGIDTFKKASRTKIAGPGQGQMGFDSD